MRPDFENDGGDYRIFFKEADLISVMSCPNFPGTVFLGCGAFSFRTEEVPGKLR